MMKAINYDSSLYGVSSNLQRNLVGTEAPKKTLSSLATKAPIYNRMSSDSLNRPDDLSRRIPTSNRLSPRPLERDSNVHSQIGSYGYRNFDTFNMNLPSSRANSFPASKTVKQAPEKYDSEDETEPGYTRLHQLAPHVQVKPINKIETPERMYQEEKYKEELKQQHQNHQQTGPPISIPATAPINKNYLLRMKRKHRNKITANLSGTKFDLVKNVVESIGCKLVPEENFNCNLIWDDTKVSVESISELKSFQRYNHFVAMSEISRKDALARNMLKMYKVLPQEFDFVPKSWIMPSEYSQLLSHSIDMKKAKQSRTFILKPSNGAMGHGIKLYRNVEKIQPSENFIVQEYIANPYLLDGFKFDLRIYALVTSCDPLRAFIFNNGLVRLGTEKYQEPHESNIDRLYMHLTNYSVNKKSNFFDQSDDSGETGSKRSLKFLFDYFMRNKIDSHKVWKSIQDVILKTLLVAEPYLFHTYKMCRPGQLPGTDSVCYEILGFDILLDENLKPWVVEVNRSPSFGANQQLDFDIKSKLLIDSFELLHLRASDRERCKTYEKTEAKKRLYNLTNATKTEMIPENNSSSKQNSFSNNFANSSNNLLNFSSKQKKVKTKETRKMELIEQIKLLRREQRRQEYENRNIGNFSRLFPIDDKRDMEHYLNLLNTSFNLFYPIGKHVQWRKNYDKIREDELIDELIECDDTTRNYDRYEQIKMFDQYLRDDFLSESESEEEPVSASDDEDSQAKDYGTNYKDLHASNSKLDRELKYRENTRYSNNESRHNNPNKRESSRLNNLSEVDFDFDKSQPKVSNSTQINEEILKSNRLSTLMNAVSPSPPPPPLTSRSARTIVCQVDKQLAPYARPADNTLANNEDDPAKSLMRQINQHGKGKNNTKSLQDNLHTMHTRKNTNKEIDEEISSNNLATLTIAVLKLLNQLEIKFPGKSDHHTKHMLQKIYSQLEYYRPKLGNYWMVKLDDVKRNKILNIVRSNLVVILQKVFQVDSVESLRIYKIFAKLLNRMLWMHGQGLWHCFTSSNNSSWETIFSKSSFNITENELKCCYRIIDLCKDCVLIVYQYAFEQIPESNKVDVKNNASTLKPTNSLQKLKHSSASNLLNNKSKYK